MVWRTLFHIVMGIFFLGEGWMWGRGVRTLAIPHICPLQYTTIVFRPAKIHQKVHKFAAKQPKQRVFYAKKYTGLKKSTLPPVVPVGTNMSFVSCQDGKGTFLLTKQEFIEGHAYFELLTMHYNGFHVSMYPGQPWPIRPLFKKIFFMNEYLGF